MATGECLISSHLLCSGIDFRSSLNYFAIGSITQVEDLTVFDQIFYPLCFSHTHFRPSHWTFLSALVVYFWLVFPFSYSGKHMHLVVCMCKNHWENEYASWIMHGVVSWSARQTVGTVICPSGPFFPSHTVVKQTTSVVSSPVSRLLLLYNHRDNLSPSIHNSGTCRAAWPVWIISIPGIFYDVLSFFPFLWYPNAIPHKYAKLVP